MRKLTGQEMAALLGADVVAHLATVDAASYPHVTPIWFLWVKPVVYLTSFVDRPHLGRIRANPRVGLVVDVEDDERDDGERPNRQIRIVGDATVSDDVDGEWTGRIRRKYLTVDRPAAPGHARALIMVRPNTIHAVASV